MSGLTVQDRWGRRWLTITASRLAVVALTVGSIAAALGCLLLTSHRGPAWLGIVIVFLALLATAIPESSAALVTQVAYGAWWLFAVRDITTPWALPAALSLLAFHVSVAHGACAPPGVTTDRATVRTTLAEGALVAGATAAIAGVVTVAHDVVNTPPAIVGATLLLVVLVLWATNRHRGDIRRGSPELRDR